MILQKKRKHEKSTRNGVITVGILGLHRYAGATKVTMLAAEYLSSVCKKKVSVLEMSEHNDFEKYERRWYGRADMQPVFYRKRCRYWKNQSLASRMDEKVAYAQIAVIDYGCNVSKYVHEICACQIKIIVGECGIPHREDFSEFLKHPVIERQMGLDGGERWYFLENHGITGKKEPFRFVHRGMEIRNVYGLGTEPEFPLSKACRKLFAGIFESV